ncbi:hypothetical protein SCLCIDRAFT_1214142 [Scleroderma citrinum Foug A]|uniref:Uncharacterized protein n=1 Tax=Scleroderma citrinum Foug A TaxID=1036808 RepID=A0A0C3AEW4_9AGAM|nr:hypothetical protein SCLCIDRAFT_1214142 [Scleroderma citrinum Foug A]
MKPTFNPPQRLMGSMGHSSRLLMLSYRDQCGSGWVDVRNGRRNRLAADSQHA